MGYKWRGAGVDTESESAKQDHPDFIRDLPHLVVNISGCGCGCDCDCYLVEGVESLVDNGNSADLPNHELRSHSDLSICSLTSQKTVIESGFFAGVIGVENRRNTQG